MTIGALLINFEYFWRENDRIFFYQKRAVEESIYLESNKGRGLPN